MRILHPPAILVVLVLTALNAALGASLERVGPSLGEAEAAAMPEMEFYLAGGETDACGRGCNQWIAAEGKIDISAAQRLRHFLAEVGPRRPPIYFHSPGGSVVGSIALGRLIRDRMLETGVAHTIPIGCERPWEQSCGAKKHSGQELGAELDPTSAMCNSACVLALVGGIVRFIPPGVKLGIHDVAPDPAQKPLQGAPVTMSKMSTHLQMLGYFQKMGIDQTLFTTISAVPNHSMRFLKREEIARFGIDRREFGETSWRFVNVSRPKMSKSFFVRVADEQPHFFGGVVILDCASGSAIRITFTRENAASGTLATRPSSIRIGGRRIELPYPAYLRDDFYTRGSAWLAGHTFDAVGDDTELEIAGTGMAGADGQGAEVTLTMDGFSSAYAKLQSSCNDLHFHMIRTIPIGPDRRPPIYGSPPRSVQ